MTSLAAVAGALGGVLALCLIVILGLSLYCLCLKRKQDKDEIETQPHSESEYFEAIDFSKIRKNLPQPNLVSTVSDSTSSTRQTVSVGKETGAAKSGYNNDIEVTSSYDGNDVEYYNTAHTYEGSFNKNVQCCNVNKHDNKQSQNETNVSSIQSYEVNSVSSRIENSAPQRTLPSDQTEFTLRERSDRESNSESQSENYFVLIKEDKHSHGDTIGQSPRERPRVEIPETEREYVEIMGQESDGNSHIRQGRSISSTCHQTSYDENSDMYFVLEKQ